MNTLNLKLKIIAGGLALLVGLVNPLAVLAIEPPPSLTPPEPLTAPTVNLIAPEPLTAPEVTLTPPPSLTPPPALTPPPTLTPPPVVTPTVDPITTTTILSDTSANNNVNNSAEPEEEQVATVTNTETILDPQTGINDSGNVGDTTINSGDGTASIWATNNANNNLASFPTSCFGCTDTNGLVANTGNGADSTNTAAADFNNTTDIDQNNLLNLTNDFGANVTTGENNSSRNVGNTAINTGDADVVVTAVNFGNNNGVTADYQEFNVFDNQVGDINFNFADPSATGSMFLAGNTGNGADSTNTATNNISNTTDIDQNNQVDASNDIFIVAETGDNMASSNTNGDSTITTGDANVTANLINFFNNNIVAGAEFLIGVVNIYGTLDGNIILPHDIENASCLNCGGDSLALNTGNGTDTTNTATNTISNTNTLNQTNDGTIVNNLNIDAITGDNSTSRNTGGNNSITTGDVDVNANTVNVMNSNVASSGDEVWWLVLVNNMGTWVGKILGSPDGATTAASGLEFVVAPDGSIQALNSGNGDGSTNVASNNLTNTTAIDQTNQAAVTNNLNILANTGGNNANRNTGGNNSISTGDVNVAANIVNFVNSNFVGKKFMIAIVNIFGTLIGDIVPPDQEIPTDQGEVASVLQNGTTTTSGLGSVSVNSGQTENNSNNGTSGLGSNPPTSSATIHKLVANFSQHGNGDVQVLGSSAEKLADDLTTTVAEQPVSQAVGQSLTVNYYLLALALLLVVGATTLRHLLVKGKLSHSAGVPYH